MNIVSENTSRKIDALGRISVPKSLRDRLGIAANDELAFYLAEQDGKQYIACAKADESEKKIDRKKIAADVLRELGYDVPEELI